MKEILQFSELNVLNVINLTPLFPKEKNEGLKKKNEGLTERKKKGRLDVLSD